VTFPARRLLVPETWTAGWPAVERPRLAGESNPWTLGSRQCAGATFGSLKPITG